MPPTKFVMPAKQQPKKTLLIRGRKSNTPVLQFMKDIKSLRPTQTILFSRRHDLLPFQDPTTLLRYSQSHEVSLFLHGSHTKKRPQNIILGRLYDNKLLDMVELGMDGYEGLDAKDLVTGLRTMIIFQGQQWETDPEMGKLRNLLHDFFFGNEPPSTLSLSNCLTATLIFTSLPNSRIHLTSMSCKLRPNASPLELEGEMDASLLGLSATFTLRRKQWPEMELWKQATMLAKPRKNKERKNITYDGIGNKRGRVYVDRQELNMVARRRRIAKGEADVAKKEKGSRVGGGKKALVVNQFEGIAANAV